jgi:hypothetical protein
MKKLLLLGDMKPSVMLAEMLEYCPAGESTTSVFTYLFLQRLPREIRIAMKAAYGRKTRWLGRHFGGAPRQAVLRKRQHL